jgi:diguanylate cyclase (GGDEF)-like protein
MDSKIGLIVQLAGVFLITILSLFLRRSLKVAALKHWTNAWLCLCFALICLRLAFSFDDYSLQLYGFYFLSEYVFGFLLVAGCRSLNGKYVLSVSEELFILPFIVIAFTLPFLAADFNLVFNLHSLILVYFFVSAFMALRHSTVRTFGWRVMQVALALLVIDFVQYFIAFSLRQVISWEPAYLSYNPVIDLVLQILLGFGMVIILLEQLLGDFQTANEKLTKAHEKLEQLVHIDPLTTAFNRHAFYGFLKQRGEDGSTVSGCVGFFDIDDLKQINDRFGHIAGDRVIRIVARSIRQLVRAEDLIYRWGGDEFFVIMISMTADAAHDRMSKLDQLLKGVQIYGIERPIDIGVSCGFTNFARFSDLENAIRLADASMYSRKHARKTRVAEPNGQFETSQDPVPA